MFDSRFSEKCLRLAFFTELLALFLASLNCFHIKGSFVDAAFCFRKSLLCISRNSSLVIQGERSFLTLFSSEWCMLIKQHSLTGVSKTPTSHFVIIVTRFQSIMRRSRKNSALLKFSRCRTSTVLCILERKRVTLRAR